MTLATTIPMHRRILTSTNASNLLLVIFFTSHSPSRPMQDVPLLNHKISAIEHPTPAHYANILIATEDVRVEGGATRLQMSDAGFTFLDFDINR